MLSRLRQLKSGFVAVLLLLGLVSAPLIGATSVSAAAKDQVCQGVNSAAGSTSGSCDGSGFGDLIKNVINILLFIIGIIAVIMVIIGGIRYTLSSGDPSSAKAAKDTILYAIIGVVVASMAYAIINFVIARV